MKVLMISSDRSIFEQNSDSRKRMIEYGKLFGELHIIVNIAREFQIPDSKFQITENVFAYPTNYTSKYFYLWNIHKIAKKIIGNWKLEIGNSVITTQDPFELGLAGWLLKFKYKLPLQMQIHTDIFSPYFRQESFLNKIRVLLAKFLLPRTDGIRAVSERIKQSLLKLYPKPSTLNPISVLPIYVDVQKIQSTKVKVDLHKKYPEHDFIILMASRLTKEKNIGLAIEAMKELGQRSNVKGQMLLLIVGDGPELDKLKAESEKLKVSDNVKFEPWSNSLVSYYKTADLFLLASNYEGYGRTVVEAMAAGVPVVMSDVGLAGELLVDELDGLVVPAGDRVALAGAMRELIENKEKRSSFIAESRKVVGSLPEKKEYLERYASLISETASRIKPKFAYVVPEYREDTPTHFSYLYWFIKELEKEFDIFLITEKKGNLLFDLLPVRMLRLGVCMLWARISEYKDFYVHYSFLGAFSASLVGRIFGGRVFYWNCGEPWKYKRNLIRETFELLTYKLITYLVTGTEVLKKQYAAYYRMPLGRIKVMPNWIDLQQVKRQMSEVKSNELRTNLHIPPGQRVILFVHRLSKRKGAHHLPEIAKRLNSMIQDSSFVILVVGDGPEREAIQKSIVKDKLSNVRMLGWIPQNKVLDYFAIADVFLMPSEEEGFPHVLLESMAAGVPFVATDAGGVKDVVSPRMLPYVVDMGDVAAISEKTAELLALREDSARSLRQDSADWVRRYDIQKVAEQFSEMIRSK